MFEKPLIEIMWAYWKAKRQTLYTERGNPQALNLRIISASSLSFCEKTWFSLGWINTWLRLLWSEQYFWLSSQWVNQFYSKMCWSCNYQFFEMFLPWLIEDSIRNNFKGLNDVGAMSWKSGKCKKHFYITSISVESTIDLISN